MNVRYQALGLACGEPEQVLAPHLQRSHAQPEHVAAKLGGRDRRGVLVGCHFAALDEDLLVKRYADRLPSHRLLWKRVHVEALNALDPSHLVGGRKDESVANMEISSGDPAGDDSPLVELINVLDRQAQRLLLAERLLAEEPERLQ